MNIDIFNLSIFLFVAAVIAFGFLVAGLHVGRRYGRYEERTVAQAAMINAMRQVNREEEEFHKSVDKRLREKLGLLDGPGFTEEELDI